MTDRKILVVVDPRSVEQPAAERAAWLAEHLSASLELFICDYDPDIDVGRVATIWIDQPAREHLLEILREKLEAIAAPMRERGLEVAVDVGWDHPLEDGIVRKVVACQPWLVVKDTHHHNVLKRTILSNTDWHLIRQCPAPLLLVKPHPLAENPKVFAAVDPLHVHDKPAQLDNEIVELAKTLADGIGGELHVLHTYMVPVVATVPEGSAIVDLSAEVEQLHREAFNEFLAPHAIADDRAHLVEGAAFERLPQITETEGAGIIVMGAVSRSGLDRVFIGSTAERVLDRLCCDLLIVKPAGFEPRG
jgi:universal stress protein E